MIDADVKFELEARQRLLQFQDEGVNLGTPGGVGVVDFVGAGVTATLFGGKVTINIPIGAADLAAKQPNIQFRDEGVNIGLPGTAESVDFVGAGVTATFGSANVEVSIPGVSIDGETYLSQVGQVITANPIDLANHVTGILPNTNGGTGTGTVFDPASIVFAGAAGVYAQDPGYFKWDVATHRLAVGLGGLTPQRMVDIGSAENYQLRLGDSLNNPLFTYDIGRHATGVDDGYFHFYGNQAGEVGYVFTGIDGEYARITGAGISGILAANLPTGIDAAKIADGSISNAEFQFLNNVSSNIQDQIDAIIVGGHDPVTLGGENYLSLAGQVITANPVNLSTTHVTGVTPPTKGGTGTSVALTEGSIPIIGPGGVYTEDPVFLRWIAADNRLVLGLGGTVSDRVLDVNSSSNYQMRIGDASTNPLFTYDIGRHATGLDDGYFHFYGRQTGEVGYVFTGIDGEYARITAAGISGILATNLPTGIDAAKIANGTVSNAEFQFINSVTSNVQDQINALASGSGTVADGNYTDITVAGPVWTINTGVVTFSKFQNIATDRLVGRDTAASGPVEEIAVTNGLAFTGTGGIGIADIVAAATKTKITYNARGQVTAGADATTSDIAEGSNLYFTDERAQDAIGALFGDGATIDFTYTDAANLLTAEVKTGSITYSLIQNVTASRLLGRGAGAGPPQEILIGSGLAFDTGTNTLSATGGASGTVTASGTGLANKYARFTSDTDITGRTNAEVISDLSLAALYQPLDADLTAIAALTPTDNNFIVGNGSTWILETPSDARTSLGLEPVWTAINQDIYLTTSTQAGLEAAIASIVSGGVIRRLVITSDISITSALAGGTISPLVHLVFKGKGSFTVGASVTVTISLCPEMGHRQYFFGDGNVVFAQYAFKELDLSWWAGIAPTAVDRAIDQAFTSLTNNFGGILKLPAALMTTIGQKQIPNGTTIRGDSDLSTVTTLKLASGSNTYVLGVDQDSHDITLENFTLDATVAGGSGNKALQLYGTSGGAIPASFGLTARHMGFRGGAYGVHVDGSFASWQYGQVVFENCHWYEQTVEAFYARAADLQLRIVSPLVNAGSGGNGFHFNTVGSVLVNNPLIQGASSNACFKISSQWQDLTIIGGIDEGYTYFLDIDAGHVGVINLIGNLVQSKVRISNATTAAINSLGNDYRAKTFVDTGTGSGASRIYSDGDYVRDVDLASNSVPSRVISDFSGTNVIVAKESSLQKDHIRHQMPVLDYIPSALDGNTNPVHSSLYTTAISLERVLERWGTATAGGTPEYYYDWKRSVTTGYLSVTGSQSGFNGLVIASPDGELARFVAETDAGPVIRRKVSFYGVAAVARQVVPTGSSNDTVITALQNLGLFSQS